MKLKLCFYPPHMKQKTGGFFVFFLFFFLCTVINTASSAALHIQLCIGGCWIEPSYENA